MCWTVHSIVSTWRPIARATPDARWIPNSKRESSRMRKPRLPPCSRRATRWPPSTSAYIGTRVAPRRRKSPSAPPTPEIRRNEMTPTLPASPPTQLRRCHDLRTRRHRARHHPQQPRPLLPQTEGLRHGHDPRRRRHVSPPRLGEGLLPPRRDRVRAEGLRHRAQGLRGGGEVRPERRGAQAQGEAREGGEQWILLPTAVARTRHRGERQEPNRTTDLRSRDADAELHLPRRRREDARVRRHRRVLGRRRHPRRRKERQDANHQSGRHALPL